MEAAGHVRPCHLARGRDRWRLRCSRRPEPMALGDTGRAARLRTLNWIRPQRPALRFGTTPPHRRARPSPWLRVHRLPWVNVNRPNLVLVLVLDLVLDLVWSRTGRGLRPRHRVSAPPPPASSRPYPANSAPASDGTPGEPSGSARGGASSPRRRSRSPRPVAPGPWRRARRPSRRGGGTRPCRPRRTRPRRRA